MEKHGGNKVLPRILPERIREAREARGYTAETFADVLGITRQSVGQYETGLISPGADVMSSIISLTEQPLSFFTTARARTAEGMGEVFWRSLKRMEKHHRNRIARRMEWAADVVAYIEQFIDLPSVNLPALKFDFDKLDEEAIESAAEMLREKWELGHGPISDLCKVLEANGIILIYEPVACPDMDAVSRWQAGRPYILYSKEVESYPRTLYNLAHELGHILLHSHVEVTKDNLATIEKQANRFAGAFLLPRASFPKEVISTSLGFFQFLKERWMVSIGAMIYRCKDLELLTPNQHAYLLRQMNAQKIRIKEPLDDHFPMSRPSVLSEALNMLVSNGVQTKSKIENTLNLNLNDVESLCGTSAGFLNNKIIQLNIKPRFA